MQVFKTPELTRKELSRRSGQSERVKNTPVSKKTCVFIVRTVAESNQTAYL